jgi:hypothetical protein
MDLVRREEVEMEGLAPPLKCLIEMQSALQNGETARAGLLRYSQGSQDEFAQGVRRFLFDWDQGRDWRQAIGNLKSAHRRSILELAACSLSGQSVQSQLMELRFEIEAACESEIKAHVDLLPIRMLLPLLLFLFPSYLLLLFGPLLTHFMREVAQ